MLNTHWFECVINNLDFCLIHSSTVFVMKCKKLKTLTSYTFDKYHELKIFNQDTM
jgi:hypothetical protein